MKPDQMTKSGTEHSHQAAFMAWCNVARLHGFESAKVWAATGKIMHGLGAPVSPLKWVHAVHNQGHGDAIRGAKAKAEGVKAGVSDIFLPWPMQGYHGLYIEMKKPTQKPKRGGAGGVSAEQAEFMADMKYAGYATAVCYSWSEAARVVEKYLTGATQI